MASNIGIKIANGEFYPLIEENSTIKKRMVLSTVHDDQSSVQIDLYRNSSNTMSDAQYIGSLVVEKINPRPKGEPSIEMVISSNSNGDVIADAVDLDSGPDGEHYILTVSLKSLDEMSRDMEIPDFELETNEEPPSSLYRKAQKKLNQKTSRSLLLIVIIAVLLGLLAAWLFFFGGMNVIRSGNNEPKAVTVRQEPVEQRETPVQAEPVRQPEPAVEPVRQPEPVQQAVTPPVAVQAPVVAVSVPRPQARSDRPPAPVLSYNVPASIPREGVNYTVRWGDTLWDISLAFYRDPWLYRRIAQHNNITNPNHIVSGRTIRIPPKN
ncbi:MAG: Hsp70 family protein [Treponema sp.]|nr:Hsp70 family protein [Treponema sp.]